MFEAKQGNGMVTARDVWQELLEGNKRFVSGQGSKKEFGNSWELEERQFPLAAVLACSDSRVPVEIALDQEPGHIFTVRTAGHSLSRAVLGSLEYAICELKVPLLVVLGHQHCGALNAALAHSMGTTAQGNIAYVAKCVLDSLSFEAPEWAEVAGEVGAAHAHVRGSLFRVLADSPLLYQELDAGRLAVVGAHYSLRSGRVHEIPSTRHGF
ncbi:MAG: carbonic anhydrase [Buchananella hordeovulneris]|nr:carbonic anhydrase [Buchananella hordeovulneris]